MSLLDRIARRRRPLQFLAAGSLFTGVDGPASAQSPSASSSPDAGATHLTAAGAPSILVLLVEGSGSRRGFVSFATRNRWFESSPLQRRVRSEPDFGDPQPHSRLGTARTLQRDSKN